MKGAGPWRMLVRKGVERRLRPEGRVVELLGLVALAVIQLEDRQRLVVAPVAVAALEHVVAPERTVAAAPAVVELFGPVAFAASAAAYVAELAHRGLHMVAELGFPVPILVLVVVLQVPAGLQLSPFDAEQRPQVQPAGL